ncbi:MAG: hypothetical protein KGY49_05775, partial [Wenzhouxiangellaceae bacterium]|nr:hypothetical protein [Wenzhouxiangellaceae bacterium]
PGPGFILVEVSGFRRMIVRLDARSGPGMTAWGRVEADDGFSVMPDSFAVMPDADRASRIHL